MRFFVCNKCLSGKQICDACEEELKKNSISIEEIEEYRKIYKALRREKHLKDIEIRRVFSSDRMAIIVCRKQDVPRLIGKNGIIAKKLKKKLGKEIRIVSFEIDPFRFSKEVLHPSNILGINILYTGEGEIYKVKLPSAEKYLMKISPNFFKLAALHILGKQIELEFE
jgi:transcription antitermination factor NusA-like protein